MMFEELLERVKYYRKLGINPLSLATGCAVKVDLVRVVYPAIREIREKLEERNFKIAPREDADIFKNTVDGLDINRRIYRLGRDTDVDPNDIKSIGPCRAITVIQIYQRYADDPQRFIELVGPVYEKLSEAKIPIHLGKGHSIITPFEEDQFALFDFISPRGRETEGFVAANNDTIHIIDPTEEPGEYRQVSGALSNTLNDLFVLGVYENLKIAPVVNAPAEELVEKISKNVEVFAKKIRADLIELERPSRGRLLLGATVIGTSEKHPPTFYRRVPVGAKLIATRPFGELAPINVYLASIIEESILDELEEAGISIEELEKLKNDAVNRIATPNIEAARVINKYLPLDGEEFNKDNHIVATTDVTGPGIYVVRELAEQMNVHIRLDKIPLLYPELSEYATKTYIIPNATAGTNGAFIIVAPDTVADDIVRDLRSVNLNPVVFGEVVEKGEPLVEAPRELSKYVADSKILQRFKLY